MVISLPNSNKKTQEALHFSHIRQKPPPFSNDKKIKQQKFCANPCRNEKIVLK
jgi:hypothetical protein